jgi:HPt (histidine-containing phosphotransfer) domain-containing protein
VVVDIAAATVEPLMRAAHSIKGAARVIGLDIAVRIAHAMEDVLVAMQKGREAIQASRIDQLLKGTDLLASLARVEESEVPAWTTAKDGAVEAGIKIGAVIAVYAIAMGLQYLVGRLPTSGAFVKWHVRNLLFLSLRADALQVGSCKRMPAMGFIGDLRNRQKVLNL